MLKAHHENRANDSVDNFGLGNLKNLCDEFPLGIFLCEENQICLYANPAYEEITGYSLEDIQGKDWRHCVYEEDLQFLDDSWQDAMANRIFLQKDIRFVCADNSLIWVRLRAMILEESDYTPFTNSLVMVQDLSELYAKQENLLAVEKTLFEEKELLHVTLDSVSDGVLTTDVAGKVTYCNREAERLIAWDRHNMMGKPISTVFNVIDRETREKANPALKAMQEDTASNLSIGSILITHDGAEVEIEDSAFPLHNQENEVIGAVIVFHHLAKSDTMVEKTTRLAWFDYLTGLPNLPLFNESLVQAISMAKRHQKAVALLFLDMDNFKHINDTLGHITGDNLLQSVAQRLTQCLRTSDKVCRRSGDEFMVLLGEIEHADDAILVAREILHSISEPHLINGHHVLATASIGICLYPDDGHDATSLMRCADTAMYQAKQCGANQFYYSTSQPHT